MILYGSILSPFVRKTMAYATEKGIALTLAPGGMGGGGADFEEASPFRKMPALRDPGGDDGRDFTISDSTAIIAYLEAKFPQPPLIPSAPAARARTVWYEEFGDTIVMSMGAKIFGNRFVAPRLLKRPGNEAIAAAAERDELPPVLDYLERVVPATGFLVEDRLTVADLAVASPFANLGYIGVAPAADRWPRAAGYLAAILARPSFAPLVETGRTMVAAMTSSAMGEA